jgi:hypothetical protein
MTKALRSSFHGYAITRALPGPRERCLILGGILCLKFVHSGLKIFKLPAHQVNSPASGPAVPPGFLVCALFPGGGLGFDGEMFPPVKHQEVGHPRLAELVPPEPWAPRPGVGEYRTDVFLSDNHVVWDG